LTRVVYWRMHDAMNTEAPGLKWEVTEEIYQRATTASTTSCVHAKAIQEQYPQYSSVKVNLASIQVSDREHGVRYLYLTPPSAVDVLIGFDQGWSQKEKFPKTFRVRKPIKIIPIVRSASEIKIKAQRQAARLAELETKQQSGEPLTSHEKSNLTRLQNPKKTPSRPTAHGPSKAIGEGGTVQGRPPEHKKYGYDNMLHERNRHFGAKNAEPSAIFKDAVEKAVEEAIKADRAERGENK
jgi:hypothetical protein